MDQVTPNSSFDFDVAVLGGGSAGYAAARTSVAAGLRTVVVDSGAEIGGLCILRGCMPTKALLYASEVMHLAGRMETWGIRAQDTGFDFGKVMARKNQLIRSMADERREQLNRAEFGLLRNHAKFIDPHTVGLSDGGVLTSANFVIATGSTVATPRIARLDEIGYLTSDSALQLTRLPKSLIVLGGGPLAVEFSQFFARFGVHVTLLQRSGHILSDFDTDIAAAVENVLRRDGIDVFTHTEITGASGADDYKIISFNHQGDPASVRAEEVLFAQGRTPNTASLDLAKAGVVTDRGRIMANPAMQTSTPHIYAAGDCTGPHEIVHLAVRQGEIAVHNISHPDHPRTIDERLMLAVIFTDPQVACVGLTAKMADERGIPYLSASHPFGDHGKSIIMDATDGHVKLLADPKTGEILGAACVGPLGGELIHEIVAAMAKRMSVHEFAALPHYHPTLAEIWTYPAETLAGRIEPHG